MKSVPVLLIQVLTGNLYTPLPRRDSYIMTQVLIEHSILLAHTVNSLRLALSFQKDSARRSEKRT